MKHLLLYVTFAQSFKEKTAQLCLFSCLYVLVNIAAKNSVQLKGSGNVLIQSEVVKPVRDLRAGELRQYLCWAINDTRRENLHMRAEMSQQQAKR